MGLLWGVGQRIVKIKDRLSIEIAKTKFQKGVFFATPFRYISGLSLHVGRGLSGIRTDTKDVN